MTTAAAVGIVPGFGRCLEPECTTSPTAACVLTFGGLHVDCGVCADHIGILNRFRGLGIAELTNWRPA